MWWGSRGQAGASGLDPRPVISRVRALVGLGGSKVGVGRRGEGIKERRVAVAGGGRRALAWRRGKKHRGRRQAGVRDGGRGRGGVQLYGTEPCR